MEEERQERRGEEEDRILKTPFTKREEERETMKAGSKDKAQRELIDGHTPISAFSSPFLSSSLHRGRGGGVEEEDEVRVALVTIEDESCPSEPFGTAHLSMTNQITRTEEEGDGKEEEKEEEEVAGAQEVEGANGEREEEEEVNTEATSPSLHLQSQVRQFTH